jgi:TetR/AcrR family transcriptional repressor of nem operon
MYVCTIIKKIVVMRKKYEVEDILSVGSSLIRKNGYHNTGINDILKVSQIPKGSFYNFFKSKEDFIKQVLNYYGDYSLDLLASVFEDKSLTPMERIEKFYSFVGEANQEDECSSGCLVNNLSSEVGGINLEIGRKAEEQFQKWTIYIAETIEEGQIKGEIIDTYSAKELADYLHQNFFGALTRMKSTRSKAPLELALKMTLDFLRK